MLFDPKWEVKTKADPLSLESLIGWLEKQPDAKEYDFCNSAKCLLGQWTRSMGGREDKTKDSYWYKVNGRSSNLERFKQIALDGEHTFGAALARARAALAP